MLFDQDRDIHVPYGADSAQQPDRLAEARLSAWALAMGGSDPRNARAIRHRGQLPDVDWSMVVVVRRAPLWKRAAHALARLAGIRAAEPDSTGLAIHIPEPASRSHNVIPFRRAA